MAAAYEEQESEDYPLVTGDYELILANKRSSLDYIEFCKALYGSGIHQKKKNSMFAHSDGYLSLFPRMDDENTEFWEYRYSSVLRSVKCKIRMQEPFDEIHDDCSIVKTTATLHHPNTMKLIHEHMSGKVFTTTWVFKRNRMKAVHEFDGIQAHRTWKRIVAGFAVDDLEDMGREAIRQARRLRGESSDSSDDLNDDDTDRSEDEESDQTDEDSEILQRPDCSTPTEEMFDSSSSIAPLVPLLPLCNYPEAPIPEPPPPPPPPPQPPCEEMNTDN